MIDRWREVKNERVEREIEREGEGKLRRADREKYISGKQAGTLLKREIRKVMDKVKARRESVRVRVHVCLYTHISDVL